MTSDAVGCGVAVASTNSPAVMASAPAPIRLVNGIVTDELAHGSAVIAVSEPDVAPEQKGTEAADDAKSSGSTPVDSVAGAPCRGLDSVGVMVCTSMPTPTLSPAARGSVYRSVAAPTLMTFGWPSPSSVVSPVGQDPGFCSRAWLS